MTWRAPDVERTEPTGTLGERAMLEGWLAYHRATLLHKCAGLDAEQLRTRSAEPSTLTLLGLVRHMTEVERWWFRKHFAGEDVSWVYCDDSVDPDADFNDLSGDPEADFARFAEECRRCDAAAAGRSLDDTFTSSRGNELSLRWVYTHMIEEYARHNGHADLLRERIDGTTGD